MKNQLRLPIEQQDKAILANQSGILLLPPKQPISGTIEMYVNVYEDKAFGYDSKERANLLASDGLLAQKRVTITFKEGEIDV